MAKRDRTHELRHSRCPRNSWNPRVGPRHSGHTMGRSQHSACGIRSTEDTEGRYYVDLRLRATAPAVLPHAGDMSACGNTTSHFTPLGARSTMAFACVSRPVVLAGESFFDALFAHAGQG